MRWICLALVGLIISCAQVPKEAVELSTTVGRDIAIVHNAHREMALILYGRIKDDVNRFVDDVYAPYQISKLLLAEEGDFRTGNTDNIFAGLDAALKNPGSAQHQRDAVDMMDIFVQVVRGEVESYRELRLAPVLQQERDLLSQLDRSYQQMHHANSIVTGHLASIRKVHDAQEELLNSIGIEGLREKIGITLAETSNRVSEIVEGAERVDGTLDDMTVQIEKLTKKLDAAVTGDNE